MFQRRKTVPMGIWNTHRLTGSSALWPGPMLSMKKAALTK